jgi:hypothetical protein
MRNPFALVLSHSLLIYILKVSPPPPWGRVSADVIGGEQYEKRKRKRGNRNKGKEKEKE